MVFTSTVCPLVTIGLRILGAMPDASYAIALRLFNASFFLIVQYFEYVYVFAHFKLDELQNLVESLPATLFFTLGLIKTIILWKYQR